MNLSKLVETASDKERFLKISDYADFGLRYLEFIKVNLQALSFPEMSISIDFFSTKKMGHSM